MSFLSSITSWWWSQPQTVLYGLGRNIPAEALTLQKEMETTLVVDKKVMPKFVILTEKELQEKLKSLKSIPPRPSQEEEDQPSDVISELHLIFRQGLKNYFEVRGRQLKCLAPEREDENIASN